MAPLRSNHETQCSRSESKKDSPIYDAQTQMASFNFVEPYLRSVFGFLGVSEATFLTTGGTIALNSGQNCAAFLAPHLHALQVHVQTI